MTITLDLSQELQQHLLQEAEKHGLTPDAYALRLLEASLISKRAERVQEMYSSWEQQFDGDEQRATLNELTRSIDADRPGDRPIFPAEQKGITW